MINEVPHNKITIGLCSTCAKTPFTADELQQRLDVVSKAKLTRLGIWETMVPDAWLPVLKQFVGAQ